MILFFTIFITVYTAINYYVFIRGWQAISSLPGLKPFYLPLFIIVAYGYILAKLLYKFLPPLAYDILLVIGAIWFAYLVYFILILLGIDLLRLLDSFIHFFPSYFNKNYELTKKITAVVMIVVVSIVLFLGNLNKREITIKSLDLNLPKRRWKIKRDKYCYGFRSYIFRR